MEIITALSSFSIPAVLVFVGGLFFFSKKNLFAEFLTGVKEGLSNLADLVAPLILLITAISMLRASGGLDLLTELLAPFFGLLGVPREVIAFAVLRPLSGSGSAAMLSDLFAAHGADSYAGRVASLIMGSSDTVFYIFAVYFAAAKVKKTRYALAAALLTQIFCVVFACFIAKPAF